MMNQFHISISDDKFNIVDSTNNIIQETCDNFSQAYKLFLEYQAGDDGTKIGGRRYPLKGKSFKATVTLWR